MAILVLGRGVDAYNLLDEPSAEGIVAIAQQAHNFGQLTLDETCFFDATGGCGGCFG